MSREGFPHYLKKVMDTKELHTVSLVIQALGKPTIKGERITSRSRDSEKPHIGTWKFQVSTCNN